MRSMTINVRIAFRIFINDILNHKFNTRVSTSNISVHRICHVKFCVTVDLFLTLLQTILMRIFAIGRNYVEHIKELNNERPDEPVIFTKPDTAILKNGSPFYYPDFSKDIHHEIELVLRICKEGKNIEEKFANKYFDAIGLGVDFTAR